MKNVDGNLKDLSFFWGVMVCQPLKNMSDDNCKKCKPPLRKNNYHETYGKLAKKEEISELEKKLQPPPFFAATFL